MSDIVERLKTPCRDWDGSEMADAAETLSTVDCGTMREAAETILSLRARVADLESFLGFVETSSCNYCGASVALMGADFLEDIMTALDKAGAPRKSPDGLIHFSMFNRISALSPEPGK